MDKIAFDYKNMGKLTILISNGVEENRDPPS